MALCERLSCLPRWTSKASPQPVPREIIRKSEREGGSSREQIIPDGRTGKLAEVAAGGAVEGMCVCVGGGLGLTVTQAEMELPPKHKFRKNFHNWISVGVALS